MTLKDEGVSEISTHVSMLFQGKLETEKNIAYLGPIIPGLWLLLE